jgi:hypothetical protein
MKEKVYDEHVLKCSSERLSVTEVTAEVDACFSVTITCIFFFIGFYVPEAISKCKIKIPKRILYFVSFFLYFRLQYAGSIAES